MADTRALGRFHHRPSPIQAVSRTTDRMSPAPHQPAKSPPPPLKQGQERPTTETPTPHVAAALVAATLAPHAVVKCYRRGTAALADASNANTSPTLAAGTAVRALFAHCRYGFAPRRAPSATRR